MKIDQGDILHFNGLRDDVVVVSRALFNTSGMAYVCPLVPSDSPDPMHIPIHDDSGRMAFCEQLRSMDIGSRGCFIRGRLPYPDVMEIADAIISAIDYI